MIIETEALKLALEALRKIAEMRPFEQNSVHGIRMRCQHCGYAWLSSDKAEHGVGCAYVTAHNAIKEALAQPPLSMQECPNYEDCKGACFQCEYFNAETGMLEYPPLPEQVSEYECRKLLYGFMLDCNAVGLEQAGKNLHRSMKEKST